MKVFCSVFLRNARSFHFQKVRDVTLYVRRMPVITNRQLEILEAILTSNQFLTIGDLMRLTGKSERTIHYDLSNIRNSLELYDVEIRYTNAKGFYIPINQQVRAEAALLDLQVKSSSLTPDLIKDYVMDELILLLGLQHYTTMYELVEALHMSDRLISEYLKELDAYHKHKFALKNTRNKGYKLVGSEYEIRKAMVEAIRNLTQDSLELDKWYSLLPVRMHDFIDISTLRYLDTNYRQQNLKFRVWLTSDMFYSLFSYLVVYHLRLNPIECSEAGYEQIIKIPNANTLHYIEGILGVSPLSVMDLELQCLMRHMKEESIIIKDDLIDNPKLDALMLDIEAFLDQDELFFNQEELLTDLKLHFQTLIYRDDDQIEGTHILKDIQRRYPTYYDLAKDIAVIFEHYFRPLSELEVSYITIYLYKNRTEPAVKKRVIVVCATGKGLSTLLVTRIKNVFPQLEVVSTMSYYQIENLDNPNNIDFVITTLPLVKTKLPTVQISNVLSSKDIKKLHDYINDNYKGLSAQRTLLTLTKDEYVDQRLPNQDEMQYYSHLISSAILAMIELTTEIQDQYPMDYETILGLTIHLSMAIPRWYKETEKQNVFDERWLSKIEGEHPELEIVMTRFFEDLEDILMLKVNNSERFAIYQYILKRKIEEEGDPTFE